MPKLRLAAWLNMYADAYRVLLRIVEKQNFRITVYRQYPLPASRQTGLLPCSPYQIRSGRWLPLAASMLSSPMLRCTLRGSIGGYPVSQWSHRLLVPEERVQYQAVS